VNQTKKLIEVALPLEAINKASAREKTIKHGHPASLHLWWARRPLAAARAVIFAQMVDDPSSHPEIFLTEEDQEVERQRLFRLIEELVDWENSTNESTLARARDEIWKSWRLTCAANSSDDPIVQALFDSKKLPGFHDPFAGGGALPLEAQRLGLDSYATELNPVAVLINKAMIEMPPRFASNKPVNLEVRSERSLLSRSWRGAQGLAADLRFYGNWIRDEATKRIGHLYPLIEVTKALSSGRDDLKPLVGRKLTPIAWLWVRTVKSPNPAFAHVDVPLATTFMLSTRPGKEVFVDPVVEGDSYKFVVKVGKPKDIEAARHGTKLARANFSCLLSRAPISGDYIKSEAVAGRMGMRLMAIVAEGDRGRVYLSATDEMERVARSAEPTWSPDVEFFQHALGFRVGAYGMTTWADLFTARQLAALATLSDLVKTAHSQIQRDAVSAGMPDDGVRFDDQGVGARAYADAVTTYLGFALSKQADLGNSLCAWEPIAQCPRHLFSRQAIPMVWDFAEGNPLGESSGAWVVFVDGISKALSKAFEFVSRSAVGSARQLDASQQNVSNRVVSTDPPYYDNVGYADLSDFFYVWLRQSLREFFPDLFATVTTPKREELIASPDRHGGKEKAEAFFLDGMTRAMRRLADRAHPAFPVTIYYAFKQTESDLQSGTASTGWETFLDAVIQAGFAIGGTWPVRTENSSRMRGQGSNALASSIVVVCRHRASEAPSTTRREFLGMLRTELPEALLHLQRGNIAPVDLAQAAIGPGMAIYTRYSKVIDAEGSAVSVREALSLINQALDEVLAEQEGDFDADSRWAVSWFEQYGFAEGAYGVAETLSKAKNTSVGGLFDAGILSSKGGKVRLFRPLELSVKWDPSTIIGVTVWDMVHHLIRILESDGEKAAALMLAKLGSKAEAARELSYRLYAICERRKRAQEALSYNALVQSWPEIARLAREPAQAQLF